jgi:hypothetical protein
MSSPATTELRIYTPEEYRQKPREFNPLLAERVIVRIANGESLNDICQEREMPLPSVFLGWVEMDEELRKAYDKARVHRTQLLVDSMISVSRGPDDKKARTHNEVAKFHAEKLIPEIYGTGQDRRRQENEIARPDSRAELRRRIEEMAARRGS